MLIGIDYMSLGKDMAPFHSMAEIKQTAQPKDLISQIEISKGAHQIVINAYSQIAHFFNCQKDQHLGADIMFYYVSPFHLHF